MKPVFLPFSIHPLVRKGRYLVANRMGAWDILGRNEVLQVNALNVQDENLKLRLQEKGLLITEQNVDLIVNRFRSMNASLFSDVGLHIAVLTTACNFGCAYCQARTDDIMHMDEEVASHVLKFLFASHRKNVTLELQGGEPLLNWDTFRFIVSKAREWNNDTKNLQITVVTNGSLIDEDKINFFKKHNVFVCVSYDGPREVHNFNRRYSGGKTTHRDVINALALLRLKMVPVSIITTVTNRSLELWKEIVDDYVDMGFYNIAFRPLSRINVDSVVWNEIGYTLDEFMAVYEKLIKYILNLNKKGILIKERMMSNIVHKVLGYNDPQYVDMTSPCGAGRNVLSYMPNGDIYPCDESRMLLDRDMFVLGNVLNDDYENVVASDIVLNMSAASSLDISDPNSPFIAWSGTCPVYTYSETGSLIGRCSMLDFHNRAINLFFELYEEYKTEFEKWIIKKENSVRK